MPNKQLENDSRTYPNTSLCHRIGDSDFLLLPETVFFPEWLISKLTPCPLSPSQSNIITDKRALDLYCNLLIWHKCWRTLCENFNYFHLLITLPTCTFSYFSSAFLPPHKNKLWHFSLPPLATSTVTLTHRCVMNDEAFCTKKSAHTKEHLTHLPISQVLILRRHPWYDWTF